MLVGIAHQRIHSSRQESRFQLLDRTRTLDRRAGTRFTSLGRHTMKEVSLAVLSALGAWIIYTCYVIHHRLFLSAISKFPGPKLAAATFWYEFYYDIVLGGKYIWKIKALHEQYGPIIRINPDELHVSDPTFWDVIYTASTNSNRRDKLDWQTKGSGIPKSILGTAPHALHRLRRSAINPFFSMQNVRKLVPGIQERVDALVDQLKARGSHKEVVNMAYAFSAFTNGKYT